MSFTLGDSGLPSDTRFLEIAAFNASESETIDFVNTNLSVNGTSITAAAAGNASVSAQGMASFHAADDTLAEQIRAVEADLSVDVAGKFAFWENADHTYLFVSDATAGTSSDDVFIQLSVVTGLTTATVTSGDLTIA